MIVLQHSVEGLCLLLEPCVQFLLTLIKTVLGIWDRSNFIILFFFLPHIAVSCSICLINFLPLEILFNPQWTDDCKPTDFFHLKYFSWIFGSQRVRFQPWFCFFISTWLHWILHWIQLAVVTRKVHAVLFTFIFLMAGETVVSHLKVSFWKAAYEMKFPHGYTMIASVGYKHGLCGNRWFAFPGGMRWDHSAAGVSVM